MLQNYMEIIITNILPSILSNYNGVCRCEICIEDIKALALNHLKPLYTSSEKGNTYLKLNELELQFKTNVVTELVRAIEIVSQNPRHENKK